MLYRLDPLNRTAFYHDTKLSLHRRETDIWRNWDISALKNGVNAVALIRASW